MIYEIISTGSKGNAVLLNGCILIDCGVSIKALKPFDNDIKLVLLTHSHGDHFKKSTVKALSEQHPLIRFGCCEWMAEMLVNEAEVPAHRIDIFNDFQKEVEYLYPKLGITVRPEKLTHNVPNCGYHIHTFAGEKAFYATDTGSLDGIEAKGYDLYLVEANHGEAEIQERIRIKRERGDNFIYEEAAAINHLSIEKTHAWLEENMWPGSAWVRLHQHEEKEVNDGSI